MVVSKSLEDVAVIYPQGYLNNLVGESLEKECNACIGKGIKKIVLDFSKTKFINSIGISILLSIIEKLKKHNGILCFTSLNKMHEEIFEMLGITKYALVFRNEDEALKHFRVAVKE
jgi:anti-anti-sigma factor